MKRMKEGRKNEVEKIGGGNREILDKIIYRMLSSTQKVGSLLIYIYIYTVQTGIWTGLLPNLISIITI